jgi:archaellum biogenesis ATPase FlaH
MSYLYKKGIVMKALGYIALFLSVIHMNSFVYGYSYSLQNKTDDYIVKLHVYEAPGYTTIDDVKPGETKRTSGTLANMATDVYAELTHKRIEDDKGDFLDYVKLPHPERVGASSFSSIGGGTFVALIKDNGRFVLNNAAD